jgi:hypothetical protein
MKESVLMDIHYNLEANLKDSYCWQIILDDYMEHGQWKSDTYKEMFYNTYFPWINDDIPDEWSLKDKEQSHGRGLGKKPEIGLRHFINGIISQKSCIGFYTPIRVTERDTLPNTLDWDSVYDSMISECSDALKSALPFRPIKKEFIIP